MIWDRLPRFDVWHSATLSYPWLLFSQIVILGLMVYVALRFSSGRVPVSRGRGLVFLSLGGLYLAVMIARLVLASFLIAVGMYHRRASSH